MILFMLLSMILILQSVIIFVTMDIKTRSVWKYSGYYGTSNTVKFLVKFYWIVSIFLTIISSSIIYFLTQYYWLGG